MVRSGAEWFALLVQRGERIWASITTEIYEEILVLRAGSCLRGCPTCAQGGSAVAAAQCSDTENKREDLSVCSSSDNGKHQE